MGEFNRNAVGILVLIVGGCALLFGAVAAGAVPMFLGQGVSSMSAMNYSNVLHAELQLQEELRSPAVAADARRRRRSGLPVALIGLSLVVLAFFIAG